MDTQPHTELTVECRLNASATGSLIRIVHLAIAPAVLSIEDEGTGLVAVYHRVGVFLDPVAAEHNVPQTAWYVFECLR